MMCTAVKWSLIHPNFDYENQLPINYKNEAIYEYLHKINAIFEKEKIYDLAQDK